MTDSIRPNVTVIASRRSRRGNPKNDSEKEWIVSYVLYLKSFTNAFRSWLTQEPFLTAPCHDGLYARAMKSRLSGTIADQLLNILNLTAAAINALRKRCFHILIKIAIKNVGRR